MWTILTITGILALLFYFPKGQNAVWGFGTIGIIPALIITLAYMFWGNDFSWGLFGKIILICIHIGLLFELFGN